jgi:ureidoacrylate peracid hydrolase
MGNDTTLDEGFVLEKGKYLGPRLSRLGSAAVIVVDMTNDFGHPDGVYPRNGAACDTLRTLIEPVKRILDTAHETGVPTIAVNQVIYADRGGTAVTGAGLVAARPWLADDGLRPGTWGTQLVDDLPRTDFALDKPRASGFYATALDVLLKGLGTETVIIVGAYTNQCVVTTARDAWARDFNVVVVTDGVTAFDERLHEATLESLRPLTTQLTADQVVAQLRAERQPRAAPVGV